jgi:hypothetical protein
MNPKFEMFFKEHKKYPNHLSCPICELYAAMLTYEADEEAYLTLIAQLEEDIQTIRDLCANAPRVQSDTFAAIESITHPF